MKKLIIVGGGIAGLSAGIHALQSGLDCTIYEMHKIAGGNCTSWKRGGYLFEGGLHWLIGSSKESPFYEHWRNVGALTDITPIYYRDPFFTYLHNDQSVCLYRDPDKLREHFISISPEDSREIGSLCNNIKSTSQSYAVEYDNLSILEYSNKFSNPAIRALLQSIMCVDFDVRFLIDALRWLAHGDGGYPDGGSLVMVQRMVKRFEGLGGKIKYAATVESILVKDGAAKGVLINGQEMDADGVVICVDTLSAIDNLFENPMDEPWMNDMRTNTKPLLNTFICLGIKVDLSELPTNIMLPLDKPFIYAGKEIKILAVNNYAKYKGYAPDGCSALTIILMGDSYKHWKVLKEQGYYQQEKERLASTIIQQLENYFPQISGKVDLYDVATPLTYERYCGTYKGSWMTIKAKSDKETQYPFASESIKNLYFAGQRLISPGGLPTALITGCIVIQHLCRDWNVAFQRKL